MKGLVTVPGLLIRDLVPVQVAGCAHRAKGTKTSAALVLDPKELPTTRWPVSHPCLEKPAVVEKSVSEWRIRGSGVA